MEDVLRRSAVDHLLTSLEQIVDTSSVRKRGGMFAARNLLDVSPQVRELANAEPVRVLVEPVLGERFFPVRGILFDKIPDANWKVPWHQDVTIAAGTCRSRRLRPMVDESGRAARAAAG